jgi:hypothetical protein
MAQCRAAWETTNALVPCDGPAQEPLPENVPATAVPVIEAILTVPDKREHVTLYPDPVGGMPMTRTSPVHDSPG